MKTNFSPLDAGPHRCTPQGTPHSLSKTPLQNQWITKYVLSASNRPLTLAGWVLMLRATSSSAEKWDTATFNVHNKPALATQITGLSFLQHIAEVHKGVFIKKTGKLRSSLSSYWIVFELSKIQPLNKSATIFDNSFENGCCQLDDHTKRRERTQIQDVQNWTSCPKEREDRHPGREVITPFVWISTRLPWRPYSCC